MSSRKNRRSDKIPVKEGIQDVIELSKKKFGIAGLPRLELLVYGAVSIVIFISYPIYRVYEESQASVYKFNYGVLVDGFDIFGGLKDDADFEWNFWRELITLKGGFIVFTYIAIGRLAVSFCSKWRNSVLLLFSLLSITLLVTWQCMLVLLCNAVFMYVVSFSKRTLVVWAAVLGQLYTIMSPLLLSYLSNFIDNEFDYHMTIFSVALCNLRFLSYCLDYSSHLSDDSTRFGFFDFLLYIFYLPLFFSGPLMTYKDFHNQIEKKTERLSITQYLQIMKELLRYVICIIFIEIVMHFIYFAAYHQSFILLRQLPLWALAGNGLCHLIFFQLKYEVMFGVPRTVAMLDQVNTPKPPVCILAVFRFIDMWRYFDRGLHSILLNYIYIPVGGSRKGFIRQMLGSLLCFVFVYYWHGIERHIFYWALFNWVGIVMETVASKVINTEIAKAYVYKFNLSCVSWRRLTALFSAPGYIALSFANLLFLSGIDMGYLYFERLIIKSFPTGPLLMLFLYYCMVQLILECHRTWGKKYLCEKAYL